MTEPDVDFDEGVEMAMRILRVYGIRDAAVARLIFDAVPGYTENGGPLCYETQTTMMIDHHRCCCVESGEHTEHACPCGIWWAKSGGTVTLNTHDRVDRQALRL